MLLSLKYYFHLIFIFIFISHSNVSSDIKIYHFKHALHKSLFFPLTLLTRAIAQPPTISPILYFKLFNFFLLITHHLIIIESWWCYPITRSNLEDSLNQFTHNPPILIIMVIWTVRLYAILIQALFCPEQQRMILQLLSKLFLRNITFHPWHLSQLNLFEHPAEYS
jgi:hypothetical protein